MITLIFLLSGLLILMLELMIIDTNLLIQSVKTELYKSFDHDTKIHQDYQQ